MPRIHVQKYSSGSFYAHMYHHPDFKRVSFFPEDLEKIIAFYTYAVIINTRPSLLYVFIIIALSSLSETENVYARGISHHVIGV